MKRQIVLRGLFGIPTGICIGYLITIINSLVWGNGAYLSSVPELAEQLGNEISAVILQTVLCAIIGAVCAASSVIWNVEKWSIAKQTGIYFGILSVTMLPIAYFARWMEHSASGFLSYFGVFLAIFVVIWLIQYCIWKNRIRRINDKVNDR